MAAAALIPFRAFALNVCGRLACSRAEKQALTRLRHGPSTNGPDFFERSMNAGGSLDRRPQGWFGILFAHAGTNGREQLVNGFRPRAFAHDAHT